MTRIERALRHVLLVVVVAAVAAGLAGCGGELTQAQAQEKAVAAFTASTAFEGAVSDVVVISSAEATEQAQAGWTFQLAGRVILPGLPEGYGVTASVFVARAGGAVTILEQR